MPRPKRSAAKKAKKYEDEDFEDSEDAESDITESDFEDPDEMEIPSSLGSKNAKNVKKPAAPKQPAKVDDDDDDDIEVISSTNGSHTNFMKGRPGMSITTAPSSGMLRTKQHEDPGFEIIKEVPGAGGKSFNNMFNNPNLSALAQLMGSGAMSNSGMGQSNILQKSLENGGNMSSMMQGMNPYSLMGSMQGKGLGMGGMNPFSGLPGGLSAAGLSNMTPSMISNLYMQGGLNRGQFPRMMEQDDEEVAAEDEDDMGVIETYSNYKPPKLNVGLEHPDAVVETASLASVEPADVWYELSIPEDCIEERKLSALQLESIVYASQQHEQFLPDGNRAGFLIGDGAGVGKGRTIAGLIWENYLKGRKRAIWVSVSNDLKYDAERDLSDIGSEGIDVHFLSKMKYAKINSQINGNIRKGVIFATYSALIGESQGGGKYKSRLKQLLHWCGDDFDGCIVFDECHKAKNLCPSGAGKPTKTGMTVLELQNKLPKARVVYASATGASEPKHMAYMVRLGIWGPGSPFRDFNDFLGAVEKRGVGAMEIVAMDMKLRGMYIARQLSFQGVSFRIDEVELDSELRRIYNKSVELWVEMLHKFTEAADLIDAEKKMKKTMWGQFWSSHQRFFKYLCIASKVKHVCQVAEDMQRIGKCIVIGLQSTGEARTIEAVEREEELSDFVSTSKGVLQSLVEKHFPAPDRGKITRILGLGGKQHTILDELGISTDRNGKKRGGDSGASNDWEGNGKRKATKRQAATKAAKKVKTDYDDNDDSDFEMSDEEVEDEEDEEEFEESEASESDFNPFGSDSESDAEDPWEKRGRGGKAKKKTKPKKDKVDPFAHLVMGRKTENGSREAPPDTSRVERAVRMKEELLQKIEDLGQDLPANTLDQLIDELGGPSLVAEMTGRKGRVVMDDKTGEFRYESRSTDESVSLELLNCTEKDRFMNGEKNVAIISEAASSGISLQADRRVKNQKRRVHMTLELPWSADRAIQQFGRTHRSNQVSAPEYILLISDLAGEQRFASIVAKRLESLGALTHGDRRATESRDLSRFNIDNKYGRAALEGTFKAIMGYEQPIVKPPSDYKGDFFKDIADGLVGVGLITSSEDSPGFLTLDKGYNDMSKFLNRILGMHVEKQNLLFKYFSDTLAAIISQAKRTGRYDQGILDVGMTQEDHVELIKTHTFMRKHATGTAKIELHVLHVERGMSWEGAKERHSALTGNDEGFWVSHQVRNNKKTAILAVMDETSKKKPEKKKADKLFYVYRPNTGQQVKQESLSELKKKYKKVSAEDCEPHWTSQFKSSAKTCSHAYWKGNCKSRTMGIECEVGLRRKTYNVLTGSVLSVWTSVEAVLTNDGQKKGQHGKMQVVRMRLEDSRRIVGTLIPSSAMDTLVRTLKAGAESHAAEIHEVTIDD